MKGLVGGLVILAALIPRQADASAPACGLQRSTTGVVQHTGWAVQHSWDLSRKQLDAYYSTDHATFVRAARRYNFPEGWQNVSAYLDNAYFAASRLVFFSDVAKTMLRHHERKDAAQAHQVGMKVQSSGIYAVSMARHVLAMMCRS